MEREREGGKGGKRNKKERRRRKKKSTRIRGWSLRLAGLGKKDYKRGPQEKERDEENAFLRRRKKINSTLRRMRIGGEY